MIAAHCKRRALALFRVMLVRDLRREGLVIHGIHHINFIVRDLETAVPRYQRLLDRPVDRHDDLPERGVRTARFRIGDLWLVLVQPTQTDSVPGRYLAEHGEGFFLLSFGVQSIETEAARLGTDWINGSSRSGLDRWWVLDLNPAQVCGAQLQMCEDPVVADGQVVTS